MLRSAARHLTDNLAREKLPGVIRRAAREAAHVKRARNPDDLREALAARDLSYRELAKLVHCSHSTVGFVLDGKPLGDDFARRIAKVLRRRMSDIFVDATSSDAQYNEQQKASA